MKFRQIPKISDKGRYQVRIRKLNYGADETLVDFPSLIDYECATVYEGNVDYNILGFSLNYGNRSNKLEEININSSNTKSLDRKSRIVTLSF